MCREGRSPPGRRLVDARGDEFVVGKDSAMTTSHKAAVVRATEVG